MLSFNVALTHHQMMLLMSKYDADGDGTVDFYEFMHRVLPESFPEPEPMAH